MTAEISTVRDALAFARAQLSQIDEAAPAFEARELLEWAADVDSVWSIREPIAPPIVHRFIDGVERRMKRVPLQHITGRMFFRGLTLRAMPGVFVCRPETEVVAGQVIDQAREILKTRDSVRLVDLCTGSGAIACSLAHEIPKGDVFAVELSPVAFQCARENCEKYGGGRIGLVNGDATDPATLADLDGSVDIVVSNPPYVPFNEAPTQAEAQRDPDMALYGLGESGMQIPSAILARSATLLKPGGWVIVEHSPSQSELMRTAAQRAGFTHPQTMPDLTGRDRYLVTRRGTMPM